MPGRLLLFFAVSSQRVEGREDVDGEGREEVDGKGREDVDGEGREDVDGEGRADVDSEGGHAGAKQALLRGKVLLEADFNNCCICRK